MKSCVSIEGVEKDEFKMCNEPSINVTHEKYSLTLPASTTPRKVAMQKLRPKI
jgi:hypothetical protein